MISRSPWNNFGFRGDDVGVDDDDDDDDDDEDEDEDEGMLRWWAGAIFLLFFLCLIVVGFELFFRLFGSYWEVQQAFKRAVL